MAETIVYGFTREDGATGFATSEKGREFFLSDMRLARIEYHEWEYVIPIEATQAPSDLPKEPGLYLDKYGDVWRVWDDPADGMDRVPEATATGNQDAPLFAPFTRLVPESGAGNQ